jgi:hypothetical protein
MALLTLNEYKTLENINSTGNDTRLKAILVAVEQFATNYCGREFEQATYVETPDITEQTMFLNNFPVTSLTSVDYIDYEDNPQEADLAWFRLFGAEGIVEMDDASWYDISYTSKYADRFLNVTYVGGYAVIPDDLKLAISSLVTMYFKDETSPVKSQNVRTIDYSVISAVNLPPHIRRVLDLYRRIE